MLKIKRQYFLIFLMILISDCVYALENNNVSINQAIDGDKMVCPSLEFSKFIKVFTENVATQRAFTKYPLKYQRFNLDSIPEPKTISENIHQDKISFPLIPIMQNEKFNDLSIQVNKFSKKLATVTINKNNDIKYEFILEFKLEKCWYLISITNRSIKQGESTNYWLERLFSKIHNCTPQSLYFDKNTKSTNNGFLESLGYFPYTVDSYLAKYKINEKFYGLDAIEIGIPSGTYSIYTVTVTGNISELSKKILEKTGIHTKFYKTSFTAKSGIAYLSAVNKNTSQFLCVTFEE